MRWRSILLLLLSSLSVVLSYLSERSGYPCHLSSSMRLNRVKHGLPKKTDPPFEFSVTDEKGRNVEYYEPGMVYTVKLLGYVHFRGLLLQPRVCDSSGYLIGSLRGGTFGTTRDWRSYGLKFQDCSSIPSNDSITHSNVDRKFLMDATWSTDEYVGPVQFLITISSENDVYWERWRPRNGLLRPKYSKGKGEKIVEELFVNEEEANQLAAKKRKILEKTREIARNGASVANGREMAEVGGSDVLSSPPIRASDEKKASVQSEDILVDNGNGKGSSNNGSQEADFSFRDRSEHDSLMYPRLHRQRLRVRTTTEAPPMSQNMLTISDELEGAQMRKKEVNDLSQAKGTGRNGDSEEQQETSIPKATMRFITGRPIQFTTQTIEDISGEIGSERERMTTGHRGGNENSELEEYQETVTFEPITTANPKKENVTNEENRQPSSLPSSARKVHLIRESSVEIFMEKREQIQNEDDDDLHNDDDQTSDVPFDFESAGKEFEVLQDSKVGETVSTPDPLPSDTLSSNSASSTHKTLRELPIPEIDDKKFIVVKNENSAPTLMLNVRTTKATTTTSTVAPSSPFESSSLTATTRRALRKQFPANLELDQGDLKFLNSQKKKLVALRVKREAANGTLTDVCNEENPCQNDGVCSLDDGGQRICKCVEGFRGTTCEEVDYCISQQCRNGGICSNDPANQTFTCQCPDGIVGNLCETVCPPNFCMRDGKCRMKNDGRLGCHCPEGSFGERCEREVNECNWYKCKHSSSCIDLFNDYRCICEDGWMGKDCDRPCQDVYGSCRVWKREEQCELMRDETDFFDTNCAVSCGQCAFRNETIRTDRPLPPVLLPLAWIIGKWRTTVKGYPDRTVDIPFDFASSGYNETVVFSVAEGLMFGTPSINFTSSAVSLDDKSDQHIHNGFLTIRQYPKGLKEQKAALMTVSNLGFMLIEEGTIVTTGPEFYAINFQTHYLSAQPDIEKKWPNKMRRTFERKHKRLYQSITKEVKGRVKKFTKIYAKVEEFVY